MLFIDTDPLVHQARHLCAIQGQGDGIQGSYSAGLGLGS